MVKEHAKDIFGKDSIYFDIKQKMKSKAGIGSIPDGHVITFESTPRWYIVEVELSCHPLYDHIASQMTKFSTGINDLKTQKAIVDTFYGEVNSDAIKQNLLKHKIGSREIYEFLSGLISNSPILVIVIDEKTEELEEVCSSLRLETKVIAFRTFEREGVGPAVHAHLFEPLYSRTLTKNNNISADKQGGESTDRAEKPRVTVKDLLEAGLIQANQNIFGDYKGRRYEAEILPSGNIKLLYDGTESSSLSGASGHITKTSTNGWVWWYTITDGEKIRMDVLWKKYTSLRKQ